MNTLIVYTYFEYTKFVSLPQDVYEQNKEKFDACHNNFVNTIGANEECSWLDAMICDPEYAKDYDVPNAGSLNKYVVDDSSIIEGPFARVISSGFAP